MLGKGSLPRDPLILVTGATGYVGGRLVPRLLEAGYRVRCLVRDRQRLAGRTWANLVGIVEGDVLQAESLPAALEGVSAAYYLIHGVQAGKVYPERDRTAAENFIRAAERANIERIIYLGELVDPEEKLSPYQRSRLETGDILRQGSVPVTEFRSCMIVGSGSALFEMVRYLAEREPVMVCPRWIYTIAQPIGIRNVLAYLIDALVTPQSAGEIIEIGGASQLTYAQMLRQYAEIRGLKRWLIPAPVYAPRLSAYWVQLVTPIQWQVVLPLIQGLYAESLVRTETAKELFPHISVMDYPTAVQAALVRIDLGEVETSWRDALVNTAGDLTPYTFKIEEGMMIEERQMLLDLSPEMVYKAYTGIGGQRGWLYMDWAWELRGWVDKLVGGVGLRRGRRHLDKILTGEALDFWRVECLEPNRAMRLRSEMKVPGKAWLEFRSEAQQDDKTLLFLGAYFAPQGVKGLMYWYSLFIFHKFIFDGMLKKLAERAWEIHETGSLEQALS